MATCTDEIYHKLVAEMATDVRYTTYLLSANKLFTDVNSCKLFECVFICFSLCNTINLFHSFTSIILSKGFI